MGGRYKKALAFLYLLRNVIVFLISRKLPNTPVKLIFNFSHPLTLPLNLAIFPLFHNVDTIVEIFAHLIGLVLLVATVAAAVHVVVVAFVVEICVPYAMARTTTTTTKEM